MQTSKPEGVPRWRLRLSWKGQDYGKVIPAVWQQRLEPLQSQRGHKANRQVKDIPPARGSRKNQANTKTGKANKTLTLYLG